jgi:rhodanese-related sulfurtransferase
MTMNTITRDQLQQHLDHVIVLEALPETHYQQGHIPGARVFPMDRARELAPTISPRRDAPIVVYCASDTCKNSHQVAKLLGDVGYTDVRVYVGGKADWASAGLPLEK